MNSPKICSSPTFKNINTKRIQSPVELKEKMRKDYKNKVQNCRDMLLNRFREAGGSNLEMTLTHIYNNTFNKTKNEILNNFEEIKVMEEIKQELIQEELDWWLSEYEKSQSHNFDWSLVEEDAIICFICQKNNLILFNETLFCKPCNISIKTDLTMPDIKIVTTEKLEKHNRNCNTNVQFSVVESHIYFLCEQCMDMQLII